jgi:hypothetical protein
MGWRQISALWRQDWMNKYLDYGLEVKDHEKHGETLVIFFRCTLFSVVDSIDAATLENVVVSNRLFLDR